MVTCIICAVICAIMFVALCMDIQTRWGGVRIMGYFTCAFVGLTFFICVIVACYTGSNGLWL